MFGPCSGAGYIPSKDWLQRVEGTGKETGIITVDVEQKKGRKAEKIGINPDKIKNRLAALKRDRINNKSNLPGIHPVQICPGEG